MRKAIEEVIAELQVIVDIGDNYDVYPVNPQMEEGIKMGKRALAKVTIRRLRGILANEEAKTRHNLSK